MLIRILTQKMGFMQEPHFQAKGNIAVTLIAALEGQEGLVLAADSRGTIGDPRGLTAINDVQKKLFKLTDFSGITVSGSSELAARLIDRLTGQLGSVDPKDVDAVLDSSAALMR